MRKKEERSGFFLLRCRMGVYRCEDDVVYGHYLSFSSNHDSPVDKSSGDMMGEHRIPYLMN